MANAERSTANKHLYLKWLGAVTTLLLAIAGLITALDQAGLFPSDPVPAAPDATPSVRAEGAGAVAVGQMSGGQIRTQIGPDQAAASRAGGGSLE